jgi:hypothetical protein
MSDELNERAKTMIWDIKRMLKSHETQLKGVLELLPDDFDPEKVIEELRERMKKKKEVSKCET